MIAFDPKSIKPKQILAAFAEPARGPGWRNYPVWVVWQDDNGRIHVDALQPDEQGPTIVALFSVSAAAHLAMTAAVKAQFREAT